jgi:hypothetical protein
MNLTRKQHELVDELLEIIRAEFPETRLIAVGESSESNNDIWVHIAVSDDDTFLTVSSLVSMREAEMLMDTGYQITIMPRIEERENILSV